MAIQKNIYQKMLPIVFLLATLNVHSMTNYVTKIEVLGKKPQQIYDFMFSLDKAKYIAWHPTEHKDFKIIKQTKDTLGSVFFFSEKMDKLKVKYNWEVVQLVQNHKIVMKAQYFIPLYLSLTFDETPNGTLVTHELSIGFKKKITGLTDWFISTFVFGKNKQQSNRRHANEEFKNLENLIK
ncbi:MAG: hypothetical protein RL757_2109 [Bacteroidota bacterium]|jgi:hypothetical protein